ncbi:MAG: hypothetical protein CVU79_00815 [Elusimicrobia bacterium HGW-Elusimicrobia-3]|nr:MAG: hypothetical protein CVU79_00815 [Elusimicrobia bacterium HGW-Elusimicrobia-3]
MEGKPDKKKESIDEILSDLNGLLNKMPSILDGIKMPEMQPLELPRKEEPAAEPVNPEPEAFHPETAEAAAPQPEPQSAAEPVTPEPAVFFETAPAAEAAALQPEPQPAAEPVTPEPAVVLPETPAAEEAATPQNELPQQPEAESAPSFDAEKTVMLEAFNGLGEGAPAPEPLAPQSLGDFMYGPGSEEQQPAAAAPAEPEPQAAPEFQAEPAAPAEKADEPSAGLQPVPAFEPEAPESGISLEPQPEPATEAAPEAPLQAAAEPERVEQAALPAYDNTRDFGIPDIDALLQLSGDGSIEEKPGQQLPEAGVLPESVQAIEQEKPAVSIQGLDAAAQQPEQAGGMMDEKKTEENDGLPQEPAPAAEPSPFDAFAIDSPAPESGAQPQGGELNLEPSADAGLNLEPSAETPLAQETGGLNLEPSPETPPAQEAGGLNLEPSVETPAAQEAGGLNLEPSAAMPAGQDGGETLRLEPAGETPAQGGEELKFESSAEAAAAPAQDSPFGTEPAAENAAAEPGLELGGQPPAAGGLELSPSLDLSGAQPQPEGADQTIPGGVGLELSVGQPPQEPAAAMPGGGLELDGGTPGGEETLVAPAPEGDSEGDRTMVYQAAPSNTSRAQAGDLEELAAKQAPEGIPAERLRTLMFLYGPDDKALCATALAELDAICLKSPTKPMFIKRASVKECDPDVNPNYVIQTVTDAGAQGLICLGSVPQEKVYEIENAFGTSGGFFRYYDSSTFSHSAALDLVADLILR